MEIQGTNLRTLTKMENRILGVQTGSWVWHGPDVAKRENEWLFMLNKIELDELAVAADNMVSGMSTDDNLLPLGLLDNLENFNLPNIRLKINGFLDQLYNGLGFFVWRGVPVQTWSQQRTYAAFLIIGKCFGNLRQQNAKGHVLGHVRDLGLSSSDPTVRVHHTSERQTFHSDSCDVVGLLCLQSAKSGGISALVSTGAIYNELLTSNPECAAELLRPFPTDKRYQKVSVGTLPYYNMPVYNYYKGLLSTIYQRQYIDSAQRFPETPRLTPTQIAALDKFDSLADDPRLNFSMQLLPGDIQFVHNHTLLHDRTAFTDSEEPNEKRHLLRIWIATPNARPLPEVVAHRFGSVTIGDRGGMASPSVAPIAPLHVSKI